jgi:WD40 repeat protein
VRRFWRLPTQKWPTELRYTDASRIHTDKNAEQQPDLLFSVLIRENPCRIRLAFSPDGAGLASGDSENGTLLVWDLKSRKPCHVLSGHFPDVLSVAYAPDGKLVAKRWRKKHLTILFLSFRCPGEYISVAE